MGAQCPLSFPAGDPDGIKSKTKKWYEKRGEEEEEDGQRKEERREEEEAKLLFSYVGQVPPRLGSEQGKE